MPGPRFAFHRFGSQPLAEVVSFPVHMFRARSPSPPRFGSASGGGQGEGETQMTRPWLLLIAGVIAFSANLAVGGDDKRTETENALRKRLDAFQNRGGFPGAVAAYYRTDGSVVVVAIGMADRDRKTPMPRAARMLAGSVGKTFFASLALQLVGEGKLGLDVPVKQYLGTEP